MPQNNLDAGIASINRMKLDVGPIKKAITDELSAGQGSEQQQNALDRANVAENVLTAELSTFSGFRSFFY